MNFLFRIKTLVSILGVFLSLSGFSRDIEIKVIVSSDIHANVFPYDFINNKPLGYGLANIQYLAETVRMQHSNRIVLLDNGDIMQGQPTAYYINHIDDSKENLFAGILDYMKYDAAVVGNHDIETGPDIYNKIKEQMKTPWLAANIISKETNEPYFEPYTIINKSNIKIAVLGLTTPAVKFFLPEKLWEGLDYLDMIESAQHWIDVIKEKEKPDVIIGLFHSGLGDFNPDDPEEKPFVNTSAYIARFVPGFDVIFTGHDHVERNSFIVNTDKDSVLVMGAGSHGSKVAVAHLTVKRESRNNYKLITKKGELYDISQIPPSPQFMEKFDEVISGVYEYSNKKIGSVNNEIKAKDALWGNSFAVDFIHDMQKHYTEADISFAAPLNLKMEVNAGAIRIRDAFKWYPYENYLYVMEFSGSEIKEYLEYSYSLWYNQMNDENDFLLKYNLDEKGEPETGPGLRNMLANRFYNFDSASGIIYTVDVSRPPCDRISILSMSNGDDFDTEKRYKVALNSYRACGGGRHLIDGLDFTPEQIKDRVVSISDKRLRDLLIDYIEEKEEIIQYRNDNWSVIPEGRVERAILREQLLLWP